MELWHQAWKDLPQDNPVPLLFRRKALGERILVARITLLKGCQVASLHHESEQVCTVLSGLLRWSFGQPGSTEFRRQDIGPGEVLVLPSQTWHGVEALEDSEVIDMLSPPGPMGVDEQARN